MVKQDSMNIFLGYFIPSEMQAPLWDMVSAAGLFITRTAESFSR
jgi:hypothetical protein